jgi:hypothetical protein
MKIHEQTIKAGKKHHRLALQRAHCRCPNHILPCAEELPGPLIPILTGSEQGTALRRAATQIGNRLRAVKARMPRPYHAAEGSLGITWHGQRFDVGLIFSSPLPGSSMDHCKARARQCEDRWSLLGRKSPLEGREANFIITFLIPTAFGTNLGTD